MSPDLITTAPSIYLQLFALATVLLPTLVECLDDGVAGRWRHQGDAVGRDPAHRRRHALRHRDGDPRHARRDHLGIDGGGAICYRRRRCR